MSVREDLLRAPKIPLRFLASLNPRPRRSLHSESIYLPMEAISEFKGVDATRMRPTGELAQGYSYLEDGDVAFAKVTPCFENGKGMHAVGLPGGCAFATTEITVLRPHPQLHGLYLSWILQSEIFRGMGEATMTGAGGLKRVSEAFVAGFGIPMPSLESQRAVAEYLDRETAQIDAFIAKNEHLIALLTERRQGSLERAMNPSGQSNWTRTTMRRLGVVNASGVSVNGYSVPAMEDEVGVLKTGSVSKGYFDPIQNKRVIEEDLNRVQTPVRAGTLIINRANTPQLVGSSGYVEDDHPNLFLSDKLWELQFERADPRFIHYWTHTNAYRGQLQSLSVGASSSMQNLSFSDFLGIAIDLPPLEEQREVSIALGQELNATDKAKEVAQSAIALANERRSALISAAVTGQIDIREQP